MKITLGILAHVDAGKTTLSEAMLYSCGTLHRLGRVDDRNTYLDSGEQERRRGITITAKQASFSLGQDRVTLIDTPGHTDFASEAEAVLPVLDCALLLISLGDGITAHTETLWQLLARHRVPVMVFINKTDLPGRDRGALLADLQKQLGGGFLDCTDGIDSEEAAMCSEPLMERYLEEGILSDEDLRQAVGDRALFPCFFGSALKMEGVDRILDALSRFAPGIEDREEDEDGGIFGARVFQIGYDEKGNRVTRMKITAGTLAARGMLSLHTKKGEVVQEKVDRITILSGKGERVIERALAGDVVSVTGLTSTFVGQGIGCEGDAGEAVLRPVMSYRMILPTGCGAFEWMPRLKKLEEENPLLSITWVERTGEIRVHLCGEVQIEVLTEEIRRRLGIAVRFDGGSILYQESIRKTVEGVGHFEPLRHYAEVHLLLEPLARGSGLQIASSCPPERLSIGWQRSILDFLRTQTLTGTLTNSPLTDMRITLISGRAHPKHTESTDFAQAAIRALRQGLMRAEPILLEPYYDFLFRLPSESLGRVMQDLEMLGGEYGQPWEENGIWLLKGRGPVSRLRDYLPDIPAITKGRGRVNVRPGDYLPCADAAPIISAIGYNAEADPDRPADSIFCKNGAGYSVPWHQAEQFMHVPTRRRAMSAEKREQDRLRRRQAGEGSFGDEDRELMAIFERTYGPIRQRRLSEPKKFTAPETEGGGKQADETVEYLLVDAYNVIFSWEELKEVAVDNLDLARSMLLHLLMNYQGFRPCRMIVVFDAYRMAGGGGSVESTGGIYVVYTREAETADAFIERVSYLLGKGGEKKQSRRVRVVTSDGKEQLIVLGSGALRVSAEQFHDEVERVHEEIAAVMERMRLR